MSWGSAAPTISAMAKPRTKNPLVHDVELWPTDRPKPYPLNPRVRTNDQVAKIAASIKAFGFRQAIVVDKKGVVVMGHGRLLAAKQLGLERVPVHVAKELTANAAKALRIADNQVAEGSSFDMALLPLQLGDLKRAGFDLTMTGFDMEVAGIILDMAASEEAVGSAMNEWEGMPEFANVDKTAFRTVIVHLKDQDAVELFEEKLGVKLTDKTRMIWYPDVEIAKMMDKVYD